MEDIGVSELLILLAVVLVLLGPGRLAGACEALGRGMRHLRAALRGEPPAGPRDEDGKERPPA